MALDWFGLAVISTIAFGVQNFAYKLAADRGCNSATVMSAFIGTTMLFAGIAIAILGQYTAPDPRLFVLFAAVNAMAFIATFLLRLEALKELPAVIGIPLINMEAALTAVIGVVALGESLSLLQATGVAAALATVVLLSQRDDTGALDNFRRGIALALLAAGFFAVADTAFKLAATADRQFLFILTTYGMMLLPAILLQKRLEGLDAATRGTALRWGVIIGVINIVSISTLLTALATGPLSVIIPMKTLGIGVTVALSVWLLDEQLTRRRSLGLLLALAALILLRA